MDRARDFCQGLGWRLDAAPRPARSSTTWFVQEITTRPPGRVTSSVAAYDSGSGLATVLRRAAAAHGKHEQDTGQPDPNWPDWCAQYMADDAAGQAGGA